MLSQKDGMKLVRGRAWHNAAAAGHVNVLRALAEAVLQTSEHSDALTSSLKRILSMPSGHEQLIKGFVTNDSRGGVTPLALACQNGHVEAANYLLSIGSDCWQADVMGLTPLHMAVKKGSVPMIRELMAIEPPPPTSLASHLNSPTIKYINCLDAFGWSPLHYAVNANDEACSATLLSYGCNLIQRTLVFHDKYTHMPPGVTALHIAAVAGNLPLITLLLRAYYENSADLLPAHASMVVTNERQRRQHAHPDPRLILTRTGRLPYHLALRHGHSNVLEWLDPSIPLMFLLSGSDDAPLAVVGVPRLAVMAASALHLALMLDLERVNGVIEEDDRRRAADQVRHKAEQRLAEEAIRAAKRRQASLKKGGGKSFRNILGLTAKKSMAAERGEDGPAVVVEDEVETGPAVSLQEGGGGDAAIMAMAEATPEVSHDQLNKTFGAEDERKKKKKHASRKSLGLGASLKAPGGGGGLLQILAPNFARCSDQYNAHDQFMGVVMPANAGQEEENSVALLRGGDSTVALPFPSRLNMTTDWTGSGRVTAILGTGNLNPAQGINNNTSRPSDPSGLPMHSLYGDTLLNLPEVEAALPPLPVISRFQSRSNSREGGSKRMSPAEASALAAGFGSSPAQHPTGTQYLTAALGGPEEEDDNKASSSQYANAGSEIRPVGRSSKEEASSGGGGAQRRSPVALQLPGAVAVTPESSGIDMSKEALFDSPMTGNTITSEGQMQPSQGEGSNPLAALAPDSRGRSKSRGGGVKPSNSLLNRSASLSGMFRPNLADIPPPGSNEEQLGAGGGRHSADNPADHVSAFEPYATGDALPTTTGGEGESQGGILTSIRRTLQKMSSQGARVSGSGVAATKSSLKRRQYRSDSGTVSGPLPGGAHTLGALEEEGDDGPAKTEVSAALSTHKPPASEEEEEDPCPVCLDAPPKIALKKCGHRLCLDCSKDLCLRHKLSPALCPMCRCLLSGFAVAEPYTPKAA